MGTLTLAQLKTEVTSSLGGRTDLAARMETFLDLAQTRIARAFDWREMERQVTTSITITGTPATDKVFNFAAGTNIREIHALIRIEGTLTFKLVRVPQRQWSQLIGDSAEFSTGKPTHYLFYNNQVEFFRVPNVAFDLFGRWTIWPTAFTGASSSATSDFNNKDDLIITLATHIAYTSLRMKEEAAFFFNIYSTLLEDAKKEQSDRPDLSLVGRGISETDLGLTDKPWADPFVKRTD